MRCRKVRSCLSAYCNDELSGRKKLALDEHLSTCLDCRKEETIYRALKTAKKETVVLKVSADFNNKLLNRIGHERFAESRTKAYFPKPAPRLRWWQVVPAFASAAVMILAAVTLYNLSPFGTLPETSSKNASLDDSYLTVQPISNPNFTVSMNQSWSLVREMARSERVSNLSNRVTPAGDFNGFESHAPVARAYLSSENQIPFVANYYRTRPVIRVYVLPESNSVMGGPKVY